MSNAAPVSLKVMAERKVAGIAKQTSFRVDPRLVEIEPGFNRPINRENVEQFKSSIRSGAIIPDIFVRVDNGRIIMVDGEHRHIAVMELIAEGVEIDSMSATQFRGGDDERIAHLITSSQGQGLTPLDAGVQYKKLRDVHKWTLKKIAERTGKTAATISHAIELAESNTDVRQAVSAGEISSTQARKVVRKHGDNAGKVIADSLNNARLSGKSKVTEKNIEGATPTKSLAAAIQADMDSGGSFKAEALCPRYAHLIAYLRNSKMIEDIAGQMKEV